MEARSVEEIPTGDGWQYEPKWDGFRCLMFRDENKVYLQSKNGQPLARYFPDVVSNVAKLPQQEFVLDGELVIPIDGALSFKEIAIAPAPCRSSRFRNWPQLIRPFISFLICSPRIDNRI